MHRNRKDPVPDVFLENYLRYTRQKNCKCADEPLIETIEQVHEDTPETRNFYDPIIISHALIAIAPFLWMYITFRNWRLGRKPNDGLKPVALSVGKSATVIAMLFLSLLFSVRYHRTGERHQGHLKADIMLSLVVFILHFYLIHKTSFWSKIAAVIVGVCSLLVYNYACYDYDKLHSMWHWMAGIAVLIIFLDFL